MIVETPKITVRTPGGNEAKFSHEHTNINRASKVNKLAEFGVQFVCTFTRAREVVGSGVQKGNTLVSNHRDFISGDGEHTRAGSIALEWQTNGPDLRSRVGNYHNEDRTDDVVCEATLVFREVRARVLADACARSN